MKFIIEVKDTNIDGEAIDPSEVDDAIFTSLDGYGMSLMDIKPMPEQEHAAVWEHVGDAAVDAGMIMIGDPSYSYGPDPENAFLDHDKMWEFLTDGEKDWTKADFFSKDQFKQIPFQMGHLGCAVVMSSGFGDGCYPVYVRKVDTGDEEHGPDIRIAEARILFFNEGEE